MNPYKLLGVKKRATTAEIRSAYRKLSKTHHPDVGGDPDKFRELSLAHEVLIDPARRDRYNKTGSIEESRVTPTRVRAFLDGTFKGVLQAQDDIATVDVRKKLIHSIENGARQAYAEKDENERKIKRAEGLMRRFKHKEPEDSMIHSIMREQIKDLLDHRKNIEDAIELAKKAIEAIDEYSYEVDPAPEGPLSAGPTLPPRYGGRTSTSTFL